MVEEFAFHTTLLQDYELLLLFCLDCTDSVGLDRHYELPFDLEPPLKFLLTEFVHLLYSFSYYLFFDLPDAFFFGLFLLDNSHLFNFNFDHFVHFLLFPLVLDLLSVEFIGNYCGFGLFKLFHAGNGL